MKQSILIPTDFSDNAWSALLYTLKLYKNQSCTFYLLHAWSVKSSTRTYITSNYIDTLKADAEKQLFELKDQADAIDELSKHTFEIIFSTDKLQDAVNAAVKKHQIDMVFMGTKGASKSKEILFGSNTINLIKQMKLCPILVVPDAFDFVAPKEIAFATDYNRFFGDELQPLKDISKLYDSKIKVVHICKEKTLTDAQNYNLSMLQVNLGDYPHSFHWMPNDDKKTEEISKFIKEQNIDILTLINYQHSFIENLINEPIIKNIVAYPSIPLLIIPALG
ncbi:universal stress protein [Olleya sp. HaHaR_3_96]|uniref:universal stress protein n=1 Tax=Olleya sp. HaHaR_3_96 TaxID=2745560 RepID=UPI001C4F9540|nr:universal stress protein [Olleya sp. HaHaR_3_96]QXP58356.1 universal stress protein [Olleya sp. HaHaR_3_96]